MIKSGFRVFRESFLEAVCLVPGLKEILKSHDSLNGLVGRGGASKRLSVNEGPKVRK